MRTTKELFDEYDEDLFWKEKRWIDAQRESEYEQLKGELNKRFPLNFLGSKNVRNFGGYKIPRYVRRYNTGHVNKTKRTGTKPEPFMDTPANKRRSKNRLP